MAQGPYHSYTTNTYDDDADADYAPRSPNLNAQYSASDPEPLPVHPQHQSFRASVSHISPFSPTGTTDYFGRGPSLQSPYAQHSQAQPFQQQQQQQVQQFQLHYYPAPTTIKPEMDDSYTPIPSKRSRGRATKQAIKDEDGDGDNDDYGTASLAAAFAGSGSGSGTADGLVVAAPPEPASSGIEVRTKFPVARIKRIMQADEDVGKVAQVTPVAVSKALELFMISLITKSAAQAKSRGSKRVTPQHLKAAITSDEQFDFLSDIVAKVSDAPAPAPAAAAAAGHAGGAKGEAGESEEEDEVVVKTQRKAGTRTRKRG